MKRTIVPFAQMILNHLFMILHINYALLGGALFRIICTNFLLQVTLLKIALETATVTMETEVFPKGWAGGPMIDG